MSLFENVLSRLKRELIFCTTREEIEALWVKYEVEGFSEKKKILFDCMEFKEELCTCFASDPKDDYEAEVAIFLEGSWRLLTM